MADDYDTVPRVRDQLDHIMGELAEIKALAREAKRLGEMTNGRVLRMEEIFHGPADRTGRHTGTGLLHHVDQIGGKVADLTVRTTGITSASTTSQRDRQAWIVGVGVLVSGLTLAAVVLGMILS